MSKIPGAPPTAEGLRRNRHVTVYWSFKYGKWIARAARRTQGRDTPARAHARQELKQAVALAKNPCAADVDAAMAAQINSPYTYKDLLISAAYGKLVEATLNDGTQIRSFRIVSKEAQQLLDSITTTTGSLLVRLADGWYGIDPGLHKQVLTIADDTGLPEWEDAQGGAGGDAYQYVTPTNFGGPDATANACLALIFSPMLDTIVAGLSAHITLFAGANYAYGIYELTTGNQITAIVLDVPAIQGAQAVSATWMPQRLTTPITLSAGKRYALAVRRTDLADTNSPVAYGTTLTTEQWPLLTHIPIGANETLYGRLAKRVPAIGDTFTAAGGYYIVSPLIKV